MNILPDGCTMSHPEYGYERMTTAHGDTLSVTYKGRPFRFFTEESLASLTDVQIKQTIELVIKKHRQMMATMDSIISTTPVVTTTTTKPLWPSSGSTDAYALASLRAIEAKLDALEKKADGYIHEGEEGIAEGILMTVEAIRESIMKENP